MDDEVKTLAVKLALEDATFTQGIKNLKQSLNLADSELKAAGGTVKGFGNTMDGVKANAQGLTDKIKTQNDIISKYREQMQKTQDLLQKHSESLEKNKQAMLDAEKAYRSNLDTLGSKNKVTKESKEALDEATSAYEKNKNQVIANQKAINDYTIKVNEATGEIKKMQTELANTSGFNVISKKLQTVGSGIENVGNKVSGLGSKMTTGLTVPLAMATITIGKIVNDYQNGMAKISTIADTSGVSLDSLGQGLIKISDDTNTGLGDIQEAEYQAISSGVDTAKSIDYMAASAKAAKGGFTDVATAVDGNTTVLNAYNLSADHANDIYNEMIVAQNLGKTTLGEMAQSIGQVADTTANCNVNTKDLFSSLAVETAHGINTSEAVSGLRESLSNIIKPTDDATKQAQALGLQFNASHLKSVGWAEFLKEIAEKTHGNTTEMGNLFGSVQGLNTMITLTSESGLSLFNQSLQQMGSNSDYVGDAFDKVTNTKGAQLEKAFNELKNSAIELGDQIYPLVADITGGIKSITSWLEKLTPEQHKLYTQIAEIIAIAGPSVFAVGKITSGIGSLASGTGTAISTVGNFVKGVKGVGAAAGETIPTAMKFGSTIASFGMGGTIGLAILALGTIATVIGSIESQASEAKPRTDDLIKSLQDADDSYASLKETEAEQESSSLAEIDHVERLYGVLQKLTDANGKIIGDKEEAKIAIDEINRLFPGSIKLVDDERIAYEKDDKAIKTLFATKKAQAILDTKEPAYKKAVSDQVAEGQKNAKLYSDLQDDQAKMDKIRKENAEAYAKYGSIAGVEDNKEVASLSYKISQETAEYNKSTQTLKGYCSDIQNYQDLSAAITDGDQKKIQEAITNTDLTYTAATGASESQLRQQCKDADTYLTLTKQRFKDHWKGVTSDTVAQAQQLRDKAYAQYKLIGESVDNGAADGVNSKKSALTSAGTNAGESLLDGFNLIKVSIANAGKSAAEAYMSGFKSIGDWKTLSQISSIQTSDADSIFTKYNAAKNIGKNASGTDNWQGGPTWINEEGPEIVDLPGGTRIIPHSISMEMAKMARGSIDPTTYMHQMAGGANSASAWGADMMKGFASGITTNQAIVEAAVASVASGVHAYLHFSVPDKGALSDADQYGLDFMELLADTIDKNSDKPKVAAQKVAALIADRISSLKATTKTTVDDLNKQLAALGTEETAALSGKTAEQKAAIRSEYAAKEQAVKDEISLAKKQSAAEIAEIQKVGKMNKDELEQEIQDRKDFISSVNSLNDEIKSALKEKYDEEETAAEDAINKELDDLENWKTQSEDTINDVYTAKEKAIEDSSTAAVASIQAEIDALDAQTAAEDRATTRKGYTDKISDLQSQITYSHDDYNTAQLQKQLTQEQADYQKELNSESVSDQKNALQAQITAIQSNADKQKTALETEKQSQLDSITAIYNAQKTSYDNQLTAAKDYYSKLTTDAALEAQSEKMIMQNNQADIIALLNSYSDTYKLTGQTLGDKLVEGFQPAIDNIKGMIASITDVISAARSDALSVLSTAQAAASAASAAQAQTSKSTVNNINVNITSPVKQTPSQQAATAKTTVQKALFQIS